MEQDRGVTGPQQELTEGRCRAHKVGPHCFLALAVNFSFVYCFVHLQVGAQSRHRCGMAGDTGTIIPKARVYSQLPSFVFPESSEMTGETCVDAVGAILYRHALKSLHHVIYRESEPISLCLSNVQNAKSFFRLGSISLPSMRATVLPNWGPIVLLAAETGSCIKGDGNASPTPGRFHRGCCP